MITDDELRQRPITTQLVPMVDDQHPAVFGVMLRFPDGDCRAWFLPAPAYPIDEPWRKAALTRLLEKMIGDLRDGWGEPEYPRNKRAFRETNWESVTSALRAMLIDWEGRRLQWARALPQPKVVQ
jgi:hypothetical protein